MVPHMAGARPIVTCAWKEAWLRPAAPAAAAGKHPVHFPYKQGELAALSTFANRQNDAGTECDLSVKRRADCRWHSVAHVRPTTLRTRHADRQCQVEALFVGIELRSSTGPNGSAEERDSPTMRLGPPQPLPRVSWISSPASSFGVKPKNLIELTLNSQSRNRGLYFDRDMIRFCGGEYRVKARVERVIIEKTGRTASTRQPLRHSGRGCLNRGISRLQSGKRVQLLGGRSGSNEFHQHVNLKWRGTSVSIHRVLAAKLDHANFD